MEELEAPENLTTNDKADNPKPEKKAVTGQELPQVNPTQSQDSDIEQRAPFNGEGNLQTSNRVDIGSKASSPDFRDEYLRKVD